jgi:hypothetical protein
MREKHTNTRSATPGGRRKTDRIAWNPAFFEAIQLELVQYRDALQFVPECQLTAEPLKIDLVIIKKTRDVVIEKNIGAIFRSENILEYKSPTDYVSIDDFYKVYGYACLYISFNEVSVTDLTITFVESRYPKDLLAHLRKIRGYTVEEKSPGIYTVTGDMLPIQIIDNRRLSAEENLWLKDLDNKLDVPEISRISEAIERLGKAVRVGAYLDAIGRANPENIEEALRMSRSALTFEKVLEDAGLIAKAEARGEARGEIRGEARGKEAGRKEIAQNLIKIGLPLEKIAGATGLDLKTVKSIAKEALIN